jgi:hypothetical protein
MEEVIGSIPIRSTNKSFLNSYLPASASSLLRVRGCGRVLKFFPQPAAASMQRLLGSLRPFAGRTLRKDLIGRLAGAQLALEHSFAAEDMRIRRRVVPVVTPYGLSALAGILPLSSAANHLLVRSR